MRIRNANVFCGDGRFRPLDVVMQDGRIAALQQDAPAAGQDIDAAGCFVIPGLVDVHTHGCGGFDHSDVSAEGFTAMCRTYAAHGTTSFVATTMTLPESTLRAAVCVACDTPRPEKGARCEGIHLEGPFISPLKKGAQAQEHILDPDKAVFCRLNDVAKGGIRTVTLAPERAGGLDFIKDIAPVCAVSLGHTAADYDTTSAAFCAGASRLTHLFNAMPPLLHRDPGPIAAAADCGAWAELICDGLHVHPAAVRAAFKLFGEKLVLVSDSLRCAGLGSGNYTLGGQAVTLKNGKATLADGTLAGSAVFLLDCLRRAVSFGIPLADAVRAATASPADSVGLGDCAGRLLVGRRADLLILGEDLSLKQVFIGGEPIL